MSKACQYATNDEKVTISLKQETYKRQSHGQISQEKEGKNGKRHVLRGGYDLENLRP
jgi:hypothetical protein